MVDQRAAKSRQAAAAPQQVHAAAWDLRMLRALPFAAVCTLTAVAGHAAASGQSVPVWAMAAGFASVCVLATVLGGRERSLLAISGGLAAGQLALHLLFHMAQATGGAMGGMSMSGGRTTVAEAVGRLLCGHSSGGTPVLPAGTTPEQLLIRAGVDPSAYTQAHVVPCWNVDVLGMSPLMLVGHLAAALAAGWWLRRGEAALWRLLRLTASVARSYAAPLRAVLAIAGMLLRGLLGTAPRHPNRVYGAERGDWRLPAPATLRHCVIRRGPPAAVPAI